MLPRPNAIDIWLDWNCDDAYQGVLILGYLHISDVPREQVLCTVRLTTAEVFFLTIMFIIITSTDGFTDAY